MFTYTELINFSYGEFRNLIEISNNFYKKENARQEKLAQLEELKNKINNGKHKHRRN